MECGRYITEKNSEVIIIGKECDKVSESERNVI
jgi:hypothetical protein